MANLLRVQLSLRHLASRAAKAEAISKGIQALARYIYGSLAYTMPVTQVRYAASLGTDCTPSFLCSRIQFDCGELGMIFCQNG